MLRSFPPRPRPRLAIIAVLLAAVLGACSEDLDGGASCAALCPGTEVPARELTLDAITQEAVVPGLPQLGTELVLPLADRDDTLQARVVIRFDSLRQRYVPGSTDTASAPVDTAGDAAIVLRLDTLGSTMRAPFDVRVYDIESGVDDTATAVIESRVQDPSRLIGTTTIDPDTLKSDTIVVAVSPAVLLAKIKDPDAERRRLRVALRVVSARNVLLRVGSTATGAGARLRYRPAPGTTNSTPIVMGAFSKAPAGDVPSQGEQADFAVIPVGPPTLGGPVLAVGGLPARRTLLRFAIPDSIDDAAAIVSAEVRLVQTRGTLPNVLDSVVVDSVLTQRNDTVVVLAYIGVGSEALLADPVRAAQLSRKRIGGDSLQVPPLLVLPADSGQRSINVASLLRRWRLQRDGDPRYLVLTAESEGAQAAAAYFWSSAVGDASLRPRLYIRYIPRVGYGIP